MMPRRKLIDPDLVKVGERIRDIRQRVGLSLGQLSERTDINKGHLSSIEAGRVSITFLLAIRVAWGLEVSVADLVPGALPRGPRPSSNDQVPPNAVQFDAQETIQCEEGGEVRCAA